jgi:ribonuclease R
VQGHPDGFGFLVPDDGGADLFPESRGDAQGAPWRSRDRAPLGHRPARPSRRADRRRAGTRQYDVVGRFYDERGITFVVAENRRINQDLLVPQDERGGAKSGDVVVVEIIQQPSPQREAIARVVEVLGGYTDPGMEIEIALRKHDLPHEFSLAARKQAGKLPTEGDRPRSGRRIDITSLPLVTIDGETAKDFDDAVYCERKGKRLPPPRGDRRRLALRQGRRSARSRRARARHVRLLPAPRDPDAAGGAVERALLAQARRRPSVHGLRHERDGRGPDREVRFLSRP